MAWRDNSIPTRSRSLAFREENKTPPGHLGLPGFLSTFALTSSPLGRSRRGLTRRCLDAQPQFGAASLHVYPRTVLPRQIRVVSGGFAKLGRRLCVQSAT